jgi:host factor-I protein
MDKDNGGMNIQDGYLGRARKERSLLTVVLNSGKKVVGRIRSFDRYTLILEDRGSEQMIFKHAIATITTARAFVNPIQFEAAGRSAGTGRSSGAPASAPPKGSAAPEPPADSGEGG